MSLNSPASASNVLAGAGGGGAADGLGSLPGASSRNLMGAGAGAGAGGAPTNANLDFYFAGPQDMLRKLETSKPVRRTRVEAAPKKEDGGAGGGEAKAASADAQTQYLFKWQREAEEAEEEEQPENVVTGASAKWAKITGNMPLAALSIGPYFEADGPKGKPVRDSDEGILVNAGGVIMLQPDFGRGNNGGGIKLGVILDETSKTGTEGFNSDDLLLRAALEDQDRSTRQLHLAPQERLWFRHPGAVWPPEAPAFPPPPPNLSEVVGFKKVPRVGPPPSTVRRLSRARPDLAALRDVPTTRDGQQRDAAMQTTPQYAAATAGGAAKGVHDMVRTAGDAGRAAGSGDLSSGSESAVSLQRQGSTINRQRAPSALKDTMVGNRKTNAPATSSPGAAPSSGGSIFRRLSFMPTLSSVRGGDAHSFQGDYVVYQQVPYVLPPPPEPRKPPPSGSNAERAQQKVNIKHLFLEEMYSTLLELGEEKIRINETSRSLEEQITNLDVQLSSLISGGE